MALNDLKKRKFGGTSRVQTADLGSQPITAIGSSGNSKNLITKKSVQTGGAGDGVGRSTTHFSQPTGGAQGTLKRFRESAAAIGPEDITKSTKQIRAERATSELGGVKAVESGTLKSKEVAGGTSRGISVGGKGSFTDLGKFKKGGKTLREISQAGGQQGASPFSQKGIGQLFGSAAELAKLFSSKEFQQRKARGIQGGAAAKGKRADVKAKADKAKALGTLREQISTSDPENPIIARIDEIIQGEILGDGGADIEMVGRLAGQFDNDQIKTILGIIR
jgi:hypothetical protein